MSYIDPTEELTKAGGSSDPYAAYKKAGCEPGMFGKRPAATNEVNTSSNSTVDNSNDSLNADQVVSNKEAGAGGAASLIKAAGQSEAGGGKGGSGGGMSNGNGGQSAGFVQFSAVAKSGKGPAPELMKGFLSFPDTASSPQELAQRKFAASQIEGALKRDNIRQGGIYADAGQEMGQTLAKLDTKTLQETALAMGQAPSTTKTPSAEAVSPYQGDGFQQD